MPLSRSKGDEERGSALIEFVFLFCTALIFTILASARVELEIRSHSAAFAIANESLRNWQITQDRAAASEAARFTSETFGLKANTWQLSLEGTCETASQQTVTAIVNEVVEVAHGNC